MIKNTILKEKKVKDIRNKTIKILDELKKKNPEQEIVVETPNGTVSLKISDALVYEGINGEIVIDSEWIVWFKKVKMKGQVLIRKTGQKDNFGRDVAMLLGVVALEEIDKEFYKNGFKYNLLDIAMNNGEDITNLNDDLSPEDLLEEKIWRIPKWNGVNL